MHKYKHREKKTQERNNENELRFEDGLMWATSKNNLEEHLKNV